MIVVGGQAPKAIRSVECYDFEEDRWDQIAELPSRRCRAGEQHHLSFCSLPFPSLSLLTAGNPPLLLVSTNIYAFTDSPPLPSPLARFLAAPSGVGSYVLRDFTLGQVFA